TGSGGTTQSNTISVGPMPSAPSSGPGSFTLSNQTPVWDTTAPAGPAVQLSWTASSGATSYQVYRNGSAVGGSLSGTSFYNSTGLTSGQTYSYYVIATGAGGTKQSNTINVGPMPSAPANAPGNFTLSNQTPVWDTTAPAGPAVQLSWTTSSGATSYQVYRNGSAVGGSLSGTSFYNSTGLTSGQTYSYYVIATGAGGTKQSNTINVGPMPSASMGTLPAAPSSLAALASNNSVSLAWTDNSTNETGFSVERKTGASGSYGQIATTGQGVAAYVDSSVTAGTTYYYRTRAFNSAGNSSY